MVQSKPLKALQAFGVVALSVGLVWLFVLIGNQWIRPGSVPAWAALALTLCGLAAFIWGRVALWWRD